MNWYSYDPDHGIELHQNADLARQTAEDALAEMRDDAQDGWHPDVNQVSWGHLVEHGRAECVERTSAPDGSSFDEWEDWEIVERDADPPSPGAGLVAALACAVEALIPHASARLRHMRAKNDRGALALTNHLADAKAALADYRRRLKTEVTP